MERLTKALGNDLYILGEDRIRHEAGGYAGDAVDKLAKFENIYENLMSRQLKISEKLEKLRAENKTTTVKFRQLLAEKMSNNNVLILFKSYGLY